MILSLFCIFCMSRIEEIRKCSCLYVKQTEYILRNKEYQLRNIAYSQGKIQRLFDVDNNHEFEHQIKGEIKETKERKENIEQYI